MKDIVILYHGDCPDGFGAAWAAWKKFGDKADYIGIELGDPPIDGLDNKEIYMLDFVYRQDYLKDLLERNKKVVAIDHHKTNAEMAKLATDYLFDLNHSGAVLAWNYFHQNKSAPKLLKYVEDVDIWRFALENVEEISSYIYAQDQDFGVWNSLANDMEDSGKVSDFIQKGGIIVKYRDELVDDIIKDNAMLVDFEGHKARAVNAPHVFAGVLSKKLITPEIPVMVRWSYNNGYINVSLRSNESVDVSEIAKKYGGGGHKRAAGLRLELKANFPWKVIK